MEVLILSKTHMGISACVGGVIMDSGEFVRLMNGPNQYQPGTTKFEIGQVWEIDFERSPDKTPHIEDVFVSKKKYLRDFTNLSNHIKENFNVWGGGPEKLFDGHLRWTVNGSGYINELCNMPSQSVGFWIPDKDLTLIDEKHFDYKVNFFSKKRLSYIGYDPIISIISRGTLLRVSLAKWWRPKDLPEMELRCYLQLSGWY